VDILVRNSQAASIYQAFVATGEWLGVDESSMPTFIMGGDLPEYRSVQRLKRYDDKWYIRLCTEDSYRISADTKKPRRSESRMSLPLTGYWSNPNSITTP